MKKTPGDKVRKSMEMFRGEPKQIKTVFTSQNKNLVKSAKQTMRNARGR